MADAPGDVTSLLIALQHGQPDAEARLLSVVYDELRRLAASYLRRERPDHTLQPTALVNEAYLRMAGHDANWENRSHFFGVAAQAMRRVLVDHARQRHSDKRGGGQVKISLDDAPQLSAAHSRHLIEIDEALDRLAEVDPRQARVVELRFFAGLSNEEAAEVLQCSPRTVKRDWRMAQAWLRQRLEGLEPT